MKKLMRVGLIIFFFCFFANNVFAAVQPANITLKSEKGLCLRVDECQICDGDTLVLDGTRDYLIYLERKGAFNECNILMNEDFRNETVLTPFSIAIKPVFWYRLFFVVGMLVIGLFIWGRIKR
jgi:hypothetical protein